MKNPNKYEEDEFALGRKLKEMGGRMHGDTMATPILKRAVKAFHDKKGKT